MCLPRPFRQSEFSEPERRAAAGLKVDALGRISRGLSEKLGWSAHQGEHVFGGSDFVAQGLAAGLALCRHLGQRRLARIDIVVDDDVITGERPASRADSTSSKIMSPALCRWRGAHPGRGTSSGGRPLWWAPQRAVLAVPIRRAGRGRCSQAAGSGTVAQQQEPRRARCSRQSSGRPRRHARSNRAAVRSSGCSPSRMAARRSGARKANRTRRVA